MAILAVYRDDELQFEMELGEGRTRIGRSGENELVLEDPDKGVSRTHAEIRYERGQYVLVDLNSQNGVWIGTRRVKTDPMPPNVPVTVGPYRLVLVPDPETSELAVPVADPQPPMTLDEEERPLPDPTEIVHTSTEATGTARMPAATSASKNIPASTSASKTMAAPTSASKTTPASASGSKNRALLAGVGIVALAVIGAAVAAMLRAGPPDPPTTTTTPTTISTTTTTPPTQSVEERFQEHYARAQGFIAAGDKASASTENAEALKALPDDPRGVEQQAAIMKMPDASGAGSGEVATVTTIKPSDGSGAPPPSLRVAPRPGESAAQRSKREKQARMHLDDGKKYFADARYAEAINVLLAALENSGRTDYGYTSGEASTLLERARENQATIEAGQKRATAQRLVEEAKTLAASDVAGALTKLREARSLDSQVQGVAELASGLQQRAASEGELAFSQGINNFNFKKTADAIRDFEKAVRLWELLPGGHKDLVTARQRLEDLKKPR